MGNIYTGAITNGIPDAVNNATYSTITGFITTSITYYPASASSNTHSSSCAVFGAWPLCWFCSPGSDGLEICGLPFGLIIIRPYVLKILHGA